MPPRPTPARLRSVLDSLLRAHGPQHWWPGDGPFEVMVGAVLTQNTAWTNVEKAITNLREADALSPGAIAGAAPARLGRWLRPSRTYNLKAKRLRALCRWLLDRGGRRRLARRDTDALRSDLLSVDGVGPETADAILLYAFRRPVFVIDAYTRRLFSRLGLVAGDEPYEHLRALFESRLEADPDLLGEYHALIVRHAKDTCRARPRCPACVLRRRCPARDD
jgi:endonuclease-3 related protein